MTLTLLAVLPRGMTISGSLNHGKVGFAVSAAWLIEFCWILLNFVFYFQGRIQDLGKEGTPGCFILIFKFQNLIFQRLIYKLRGSSGRVSHLTFQQIGCIFWENWFHNNHKCNDPIILRWNKRNASPQHGLKISGVASQFATQISGILLWKVHIWFAICYTKLHPN
jgi:hypothetical protein